MITNRPGRYLATALWMLTIWSLQADVGTRVFDGHGGLLAQVPVGGGGNPTQRPPRRGLRPGGTTGPGGVATPNSTTGGVATPTGSDPEGSVAGPDGSAAGPTGAANPGGTSGGNGAGNPGGNGGNAGGATTGGNGRRTTPNGGNGLPGPLPTPGRIRPGITPGVLGPALGNDDWQNWWLLSADWYLDVERRYRKRFEQREASGDLFMGESAPSDEEGPVEAARPELRDRVRPAILKSLKHDHPSVRAEAALALGRCGQSDDIRVLLPVTKDKNALVRRAAILGMGMLKDPKASPYLISILRDPATLNRERATAAFALGLVPGDASAAALMKVARSSRAVRDIRATALYALGFIGGPKGRILLESFITGAQRDHLLRACAVQGLTNSSDPLAVPLVLHALLDKNIIVRRSAALGLGRMNFKSAYRAELEQARKDLLLFDGDGFSVRAEAQIENVLTALRLKTHDDEKRLAGIKKRVVTALMARLAIDSDVMVRNFALISLGQLGGKEAEAALARTYRKASLDSTRSFAALGMGIGHVDVMSGMLKFQLKKKRLVHRNRAAILLSLGLMAPVKGAGELAHANLRTRSDLTVTSFAALAIGLLDHRASIPTLRKTMRSKSRPELKPSFGVALALLGDAETIRSLGKKLTERATVNTKVQAARALEGIKDIRSMTALLKALEKRGLKDRVAAAVVRALGVVAERGDRPILADHVRGLNYLMGAQTLNEVALL